MANKKSHLTYEEKFCIEKMLRAGNRINHIARALDRGASTISQEIARNGGKGEYKALEAEKRAKTSQNNKKLNSKKISNNNDLQKFVTEHTEKGCSPETIAKMLRKQSEIPYASGKSIRKYLYKH